MSKSALIPSLRCAGRMARSARIARAEHYYLATQRRWKCKACAKQFSVKVGTIFEDSPIRSTSGFALSGCWSTARTGLAPTKSPGDLGITQKSAWFVLHRLRLALQRSSLVKLGGEGNRSRSGRNFHRRQGSQYAPPCMRAGSCTGGPRIKLP